MRPTGYIACIWIELYKTRRKIIALSSSPSSRAENLMAKIDKNIWVNV